MGVLLRTALVLFAMTGAVGAPFAAVVTRPGRRSARVELVAASGAAASGAASVRSPSAARTFAAGWGVCGVMGILAQAIGRLAPVALQPLTQMDLTVLQWGLCAPHRPLPCWHALRPRPARAGRGAHNPARSTTCAGTAAR